MCIIILLSKDLKCDLKPPQCLNSPSHLQSWTTDKAISPAPQKPHYKYFCSTQAYKCAHIGRLSRLHREIRQVESYLFRTNLVWSFNNNLISFSNSLIKIKCHTMEPKVSLMWPMLLVSQCFRAVYSQGEVRPTSGKRTLGRVHWQQWLCPGCLCSWENGFSLCCQDLEELGH